MWVFVKLVASHLPSLGLSGTGYVVYIVLSSPPTPILILFWSRSFQIGFRSKFDVEKSGVEFAKCLKATEGFAFFLLLDSKRKSTVNLSDTCQGSVQVNYHLVAVDEKLVYS